jgi:hypothetical protein
MVVCPVAGVSIADLSDLKVAGDVIALHYRRRRSVGNSPKFTAAMRGSQLRAA